MTTLSICPVYEQWGTPVVFALISPLRRIEQPSLHSLLSHLHASSSCLNLTSSLLQFCIIPGTPLVSFHFIFRHHSNSNALLTTGFRRRKTSPPPAAPPAVHPVSNPTPVSLSELVLLFDPSPDLIPRRFSANATLISLVLALLRPIPAAKQYSSIIHVLNAVGGFRVAGWYRKKKKKKQEKQVYHKVVP